MQLAFSALGLSNLIALLRGSVPMRPSPCPPSMPIPRANENGADRTLAMELMDRHPEAFQNENNIMLLMALFPKFF